MAAPLPADAADPFAGLPVIDPLPLLLAAARGDQRVLIGLAAEPGAGKSTLAAQLCADVNAAHPGACVALSVDGFHLTRAQLTAGAAGRSAEESHRRRGAPWTFDPRAAAARLRAVRAAGASGARVAWPAFDHAVKDPEEDAVAIEPAARVVIVEGLYLLHRADGWEALEGLLDACYYVGTPFALADARLLARHQQAWGISEAEARQRIAENDGVNALLCRASIARAAGVVLPRSQA